MAVDSVKYKAKDGTLINLTTKVINNTTSTSTTDALSANQGKVINDRINNEGILRKDLVVTDTTDWNSITDPGCYKVQCNSFGNYDSHHGPNGYINTIYTFGLLLVIAPLKDNRLTQIYIPHFTGSSNHHVVQRTRNGGEFTNWISISGDYCIREASTTDLTAGTSNLPNGQIYLVY